MSAKIGRTNNSEPTIFDSLLFFLLFSGPPKFRLRDPNASLDGVIDWVVLLHIVVWALAGLWIVNRVWLSKTRVGFKPSSLEKLSLLLVCCLSVSILFSEGPALTAFKVYQLLVTILFASVFVRRHGIRACLEGILVGSAILCAADVVAALTAPSMVFGETEFGSRRFTGELIAQTGVVGTLALVLLLSTDRKRSRLAVATGIALFGSVLLFSLMRTSYLAFVAFLLLALWKAPEIKLLKRVARGAFLVLPLAVVGGALAQLEEYRSAESVWTLSDRVGLWAYLVDTMWNKSPWFGLGYFSASRIYGQEYAQLLGAAHSVFVEVLSGGGLVSFAVFLLLWCFLLFYVFRLLREPLTATSFAVIGLLVVTCLFVFIGSELEAGPAGFTFWIIVPSVPLLCQQRAGAEPGSCSQFAMSAGRATLPRPI
jgi:O-antigen ligase